MNTYMVYIQYIYIKYVEDDRQPGQENIRGGGEDVYGFTSNRQNQTERKAALLDLTQGQGSGESRPAPFIRGVGAGCVCCFYLVS